MELEWQRLQTAVELGAEVQKRLQADLDEQGIGKEVGESREQRDQGHRREERQGRPFLIGPGEPMGDEGMGRSNTGRVLALQNAIDHVLEGPRSQEIQTDTE